MSSRELNRRSLGKTIVAMAMVATVQPLRLLVAAEETKAQRCTKSHDAASRSELPFVCISRRTAEGDLVTFLKKREAMNQGE